MKKALAVVGTVALAIGVAVYVKENAKPEIKNYEYYTFQGKMRTSHKCEANEKVMCEYKGKMIEVAQFSEVVE